MKKLVKVIKFEGFESMLDLEDRVNDALDELEIPGDFEGTLKVTLTYIPEEGEDVED